MQSNELLTSEADGGITSYAELLEQHNLVYQEAYPYLQVGEISGTQGWILHVSVIKPELISLLQELIPFLSQRNIPFKIPISEDAAKMLLTGMLGQEQLGKIVGIYPPDERMAVELAKLLVRITTDTRGPGIPSDAPLGGTVYTRYGSFNPVIMQDASGNYERFIYDKKGELVKDELHMPFFLPKGVKWPFASVHKFTNGSFRRIIRGKYLPYMLLKSDAKGMVIKGISLKRLNIKWCIIKEAKRYMWGDESGRFIQDRLAWQNELHNDLSGELPVPKIYDFIEEGDTSYLIMQCIDGKSFDAWLLSVFQGNSWLALSRDKQQHVIDKLLEIVVIVDRLHKRGYVHRDITPENFMIDVHEKIWLIDMEMTYSSKLQKPVPPFRAGTPGYMSPEQIAAILPTHKEDIYAIGATLVIAFLRIGPWRQEMSDLSVLESNLRFYIRDAAFVQLIISCLQPDAASRPEINEIIGGLKAFKERPHSGVPVLPPPEELSEVIQSGIAALASPLLVTPGKLWFSYNRLVAQNERHMRFDTQLYPGLYFGVAGVSYFLSLATAMGYSLKNCSEALGQGWQFISQAQLGSLPEVAPGLYDGSYGTAVAIALGIRCKMLDGSEEMKQVIQSCLSIPAGGYGLSAGAAGLGIAVLQCASLLPEEFTYTQLQGCHDFLVANQGKDGSWKFGPEVLGDESTNTTGLRNGVSGIAWFMLAYYSLYPHERTKAPLLKALEWIMQERSKQKPLPAWEDYAMNTDKNAWMLDGDIGVALCFIKAYELFGDERYKAFATKLLHLFPAYIAHLELSQYRGLAGLGEVYLEAQRVLKDPEWKERTDWLVHYFMHTWKYAEDKSRYWFTCNTNFPVAELASGGAGILHFLLRYLHPEKLGCPILTVAQLK
ncbi:MAG TPA: lanthionine synthetase LanC family protein [Chitinophaga sp.]|uniref:class III lanthionine synthetase LanKC N-terminal domain-containing protein n=1 Tax=Chitinophaga sp. TaxID=1869181 RepID=UPI002BAA4DD2|nr:lanthionine synthetase LanC family protein [Chitinophaga sp.]HVI47746.1 lanthionine synthetase LanC family protein [Chitinophaga sp.]